MSKIIAFLVIFPFLIYCVLLGVGFYEFDTKSRYLKDYCDMLTYKVKITGVVTTSDYADFSNKINSLSSFTNQGLDKSIDFRQGSIDSTGNIQSLQSYVIDTTIARGDIFIIIIKSSSVSNFSRLINWGTNIDDSKNLYYKIQSSSRIEKL